MAFHRAAKQAIDGFDFAPRLEALGGIQQFDVEALDDLVQKDADVAATWKIIGFDRWGNIDLEIRGSKVPGSEGAFERSVRAHPEWAVSFAKQIENRLWIRFVDEQSIGRSPSIDRNGVASRD